MPTIEIASINSLKLDLNQNNYLIAIIEENKLNSHRGLFYDLLQRQDGSIVHIGNPKFKDEIKSGFFAGDIIDWYDNNYFRFLEIYKKDIDSLLKISLLKSPVNKVLFLSDCQFGPEKEMIENINSVHNFWNKHDSEGLVLNTMYEIYGE